MSYILSYLPWVFWLLPLFSVPFAPLFARAGHKAVWSYSLAVSAVSFLFSALTAYTFETANNQVLTEWVQFLSVPLQITVDPLSLIVSVLVSFLSMLVILYSLSYIDKSYARYYSLILLFAGSMLGLVMAGNLIQFYFFWELVGICSALLIAFWNEREEARKAGMKAFVVTRVGDASLLLAIFIVYSVLGVTSFSDLLSNQGKFSPNLLILFGVLAFIGAMGKSAQVPLHGWLPDAMEGPTTVSALIHAATMVNAGVYLIVRLSPVYLSNAYLSYLVLTIGLLSSFVGGLGALGADDIKRVLAYSTISQLGLMFAAIGLGSASSATYHLISQGLFKALAFLSAGAVIKSLGTRNMNEMGGLWRKMKITYAGFLLSMLAMSGLPPLVGFWSKESIISAAGEGITGYIIILSSILTSAYCYRALIKVFHGSSKVSAIPHDPHLSMALPIIILSFSVVFGSVFLSSQHLVQFISYVPIVAYILSLGIVFAGILPNWLAFNIYSIQFAQTFSGSRLLKELKQILLSGLGFDALYRTIAELFNSLSKYVAFIQTGSLRYNALLVFALVVFLLVVVSVL